MVVFDTLLISDDAKSLIIDVHVNEADYFEGYTITDVFINTDESYLESGVNEEKAIYHKEFNDEPRKISLLIDCSELTGDIKDFGSNLFFVYVRVKPKANKCSECLPCVLDTKDTLGVTFDTGLLYNIGLGYIKELADNCNIPQGFSDFVLNWEGFKLLIESDHYIDAIKIFQKLFKNGTRIMSKSNCGCNGKISI